MFYGRGPRKAKLNTTAEIIRFNESDIPGGGQVKQFMIDMTGANRDFDSLNAIVVKANAQAQACNAKIVFFMTPPPG